MLPTISMMNKKEWFENWFDSPFYPLLYDHRDMDEAGRFVDNLMRYLAPPIPSRLLDIACGEGRFAAQLAGYGHEVTGIDLSEHRIKVAKELENERLRFYVHDMRYPTYINYFDYAFNFFTSFGYFEQARDHRMAANAFAAGLKSKGILVLDYLNKTVVGNTLVPTETIIRGGIGFHINRYIEAEHIFKEINLTDDDGLEHHYQERVRAFERADFEILFGHAGLELNACFGDYDLNAFQKETSPRLIMIFQKK